MYVDDEPFAARARPSAARGRPAVPDSFDQYEKHEVHDAERDRKIVFALPSGAAAAVARHRAQRKFGHRDRELAVLEK